MNIRLIIAVLLSFSILICFFHKTERVINLKQSEVRDGLVYELNDVHPFDGTIISQKYPNGQKAIELNYKKGKLDGFESEWYT